MYISLALLAFDKGGNPHLFKDLPLLEHNPDKKWEWAPCVFADADTFLGPVYLVNEKGKTYIPEPTEIVHYKSYSWSLPCHSTQAGERTSETEDVRVCLEEGVVRIVPKLNSHSLHEWDFK